MKIFLNHGAVLWAIGVLQPVSAEELRTYFQRILSDPEGIPTAKEFYRFCLIAINMKHLVRVDRERALFALTLHGSRYLSDEQRKSRDRQRMFLLKEARQSRIQVSREVDATGSGGVAPSADARLRKQRREAKTLGLSVPRGQGSWPRFSQQLNTGLSLASRDTFFSPFFSFASADQLAIACGRSVDSLTLRLYNFGPHAGRLPETDSTDCVAPRTPLSEV